MVVGSTLYFVADTAFGFSCMIKEKFPAWNSFSNNLGTLFSALPISPNVYSWLTVPAALFGLICIILGCVGWGVLGFVLAGILDVIDGAVARKKEITSHYGAFLDGSLDRLVDFFVIFSYYWLPLSTPWLPIGPWIAIAYFFAIMPSFEVAYANHRFAVIDPDEKIIWRILNRGEMYPIMVLIPLIAIFNPTIASVIFMILVFLSFVTTLQTFIHTLHLASDS